MALTKVRTGPTSYLKMTEADAEAYRKNVGEYGVDAAPEPAPAPEPTDEPKAKAKRGPVEDKALKMTATKQS